MKILLINPPRTFFLGSLKVTAGLPLGIMYIAAMLDKEGYKVEILDALTVDSPCRREGDTMQYGMSWEEIRRAIITSKSAIVGIANPFTAQLDNAIRISQIVKEIDPQIPTIVGGPHVSVCPAEFLKKVETVDVAVIGEGEYTMLEIVKHYEGVKSIDGMDGIAYRKDGEVILNPRREFIRDLDQLPFPAYHLVDMEKYLNPKPIRYRQAKYKREIPMITSRGCPFNCVFCSIHLHMGKKFRANSKEYVIAHIEHLINTYGVNHIHFEDDNLTLNIKRFEEILDAVMERGLKFSWDAPNGIRADRLTREILVKMRKTGCTNLMLGVESGDQYILDNIIDKRLRLEVVIKTAQLCQEVGIRLGAFYMIGLPGEKQGNMERTIDFALWLLREYGVFPSILVAIPLYGTRLYRICQEKGYLARELSPRTLSEAGQRYGKGLIRTEDFTPDDVNRLACRAFNFSLRLSLLRYLKHPREAVRLLRNPRSFFYSLRMLRR